MSLALGKQPCKRELAGRAFLFIGDGFDTAGQDRGFFWKFFALEARRIPAVIVRRKILEAFDLAGEKAAAKRAISDESNPQIARCGQDFIFRIAASRANTQFAERRSDALCERAGWCWQKPRTIRGSELCPPLPAPPSHPTVFFFFFFLFLFFDRHSWVDAVLVIQVNFLPRPGVSNCHRNARADIFGFPVHRRVPLDPFLLRTMPNFPFARKTLSRRPRMAWPTRSSLSP